MPVIIPPHVTHSQVNIIDAIPISAGFFRIEKGLLVTYGKSESLELKPLECDTRLLNCVLGAAPTSSYLP